MDCSPPEVDGSPWMIYHEVGLSSKPPLNGSSGFSRNNFSPSVREFVVGFLEVLVDLLEDAQAFLSLRLQLFGHFNEMLPSMCVAIHLINQTGLTLIVLFNRHHVDAKPKFSIFRCSSHLAQVTGRS